MTRVQTKSHSHGQHAFSKQIHCPRFLCLASSTDNPLLCLPEVGWARAVQEGLGTKTCVHGVACNHDVASSEQNLAGFDVHEIKSTLHSTRSKVPGKLDNIYRLASSSSSQTHT